MTFDEYREQLTEPTKVEFMKPGDKNKTELLEILRGFFGDMVQTEYRFHPVRRWRFDYAVPEAMLAVEYHGHAGFIGGGASGHSSIKGLSNDCEKVNSAIGLGWRVLAFTALHFRDRERDRHKLMDIRTTIINAMTAIQNEKEKNEN